MRPVLRTSSLVLVSGAGAMTASDADAEVLEKPGVEPAKPVAPPPADPSPAAPPSLEARKIGGGGAGPPDGSGGGAGGGSGDGPAAPARAGAHTRRRFNQDDLFGVIFGLAVIAFLLLWVVRGRGNAGPVEPDALVSPQSVPNAVAAPPPPVDPFGNAPVNLRPTGEAPSTQPDAAEAAPADTQQAAPATPPVVAAAPPPAAAPAPATLPLAARRMNAWFCTASSRLTRASRENLTAEIERFAGVFEGRELIVRGYADTRGATAYNAALSGERARVVADFLRTRGLAVAEVSGVGELEGLDDNQNCPNQRRVDVWVKGGPAEEPSRDCTPAADLEPLVCPR